MPTPHLRPGTPAISILTTAALAPKIATLVLLAAADLPVPEALALPDPTEPDEPTWHRIDLLLKGGPVIVRAALHGEDGPESAAAGLGTSIAGCHDRESVRAALRRITEALAEPWLTAYFPTPPTAQVLVQREITGPWLAVVAQTELRHLELHPRDPESLAAGHSPTLAGPLALFPAELRRAIDNLCDRVTATLPPSPHGLDLELVADSAQTIWLVQARPLTRPLHPGWPAFAAAARRDLDPTHATSNITLPLPGLWRLDAEHNPAPLSPAHAGVISRLARTHPDLVRARVLAGWLFEPDRLRRPTATDRATLLHALHDLEHLHIPTARAALLALERRLPTADLAPLVDLACDLLRDVLERYATLPPRPASLAPSGGPPSSLTHRAHLDILPAAWDIASPTLHDLSPETAQTNLSPETAQTNLSPETPTEALATLLGELDDHLFALGLAPLRRVYLRAAGHLGISTADIFLLTPDELQSALRGASFGFTDRRREHAHQATLFPPLQLFDGLPVPARGDLDPLQGVAIGPVVEGPLAPRQGLADLLAAPPSPAEILAIPALTAQAAVVLHALGVRAVCCEHGGAMSHAALMARELGLSALIGCRGCTNLASGTWVRLDTRTGRLRVRPT